MLRVCFANRFEALLEALHEGLAAGPASPLLAEQIIIPSAAIQARLTQAIADRRGICANVQFSFLGQWLWRQIGRFVPAVAADSPFAPPLLAWRVFAIFADAGFLRQHPRLRDYLADADAVMRFDLATRVATLLEQYLSYRPDWLALWSADKLADISRPGTAQHDDQRWQAALWRRIAAELGTAQQHPAVSFLAAVASLGEDARLRSLPASAHFFCLPAIAPLYLDILRQLGRWIDLRLYVLNPCREYWFDIVDRKRLSYLALRGEADYHESGNRLLAHWGQQTKSAIDLLLEDGGAAVIDDGRFADDDSGSMLAALHNAILALEELAPGSLADLADDRSIEVHVCHSLTRELEVLQDQLLALFAAAAPPRPGDILVVIPDLEAAAPLIDAVFGNAPRDRHIPYTITGRPRSGVNAAARALLALLALAASRFKASEIYALLLQPIIARRFGIGGDDLDLVRDWFEQAALRWGIDAEHRRSCGLPADEHYTLRAALRKLFLGYALPNESSQPLQGQLPAGTAAGTAALTLGSLWHFLDRLTSLRATLAQARDADGWMQALSGLIDDFMLPTATELEDCAEVRAAVRRLHANMSRGGAPTGITLDVVHTALQSLLDESAHGGVPGGALTFCAIASLRNVPYRIVCAIGLNDGVFPGRERPPEFDLMAAHPRRGDRQRRLDERNLFLDLLLSARERLILSYTGRSVRDNSPRPASVLVEELLDTLAAAIAATAAPAALAAARRRLLVEHPLQAFAAAGYSAAEDPRRRSFNAEYCAALQAAAAPAQIPGEAAAADEADDAAPAMQTLFFHSPLATPGEDSRRISLEQLARFFAHPCRALLQQRLGLTLSEGAEALADDEPFLPAVAARSRLAARLLPPLLAGEDMAGLQARAAAGDEYPPGRLCQQLLALELAQLGRFAAALGAATAAACLPPRSIRLDFAIAGEAWQLSAEFDQLRPNGLLLYRYDELRGRDYLAGWLSHLLLCAAPGDGAARTTRWLGREGEYKLRPCADAGDILGRLLSLYRQGLSEPLHFYPKTAWAYASSGWNLGKARAAWRHPLQADYGEENDRYFRLALRGVAEPLDAAFRAHARCVFEPLLACLEAPP